MWVRWEWVQEVWAWVVQREELNDHARVICTCIMCYASYNNYIIIKNRVCLTTNMQLAMQKLRVPLPRQGAQPSVHVGQLNKKAARMLGAPKAQ